MRTTVIEAETTICRLCETPLPQQPVIHLTNVPARIQTFPDQANLEADKGTDLKAYQCIGCGHIQLASQPVIYTAGVTSTTKYSTAMLDYRQNQVKEFLTAHHLKGKKILDVGCGDGHLLGILQQEGAVGIGVDASEHSLEIAREHGYTAHFGYVQRGIAVQDGPFDGFVCYDVIEHVPDIKDFLQGIAYNLAPGGVGLLETPSFEKVLETKRFFDFMQDHLAYFTVDTLRRAFEISGFDVLHIERNRDAENLTVIAQKRPLTDFGPMLLHKESLMENVSTFIAAHKAEGRRVAIWGASIQTLTLSALMALDVAYIIDSAPYKQGQVTQVSHLPIVSPETLKTDPVDVIIINAPRYADEIYAQIVNKSQFGGVVASLVSGEVEILS